MPAHATVETISSNGLSSLSGGTACNTVATGTLGTSFTSVSISSASSSSSSPGANSLSVLSAPLPVTAFNEAAKSGFVSAAVPLHYRVPMKTKKNLVQ